MNPALIVAIPVGMLLLGLILNGFPIGMDQPASPSEQDPMKRVEAERQAYRNVFDQQRSRSIVRQKNAGRFIWLMMIVTIGAFIWLYMDTVGKTTTYNQIATVQTLGTEGGKDMVLSLTTSGGANVKYLIKPLTAAPTPGDAQTPAVAEKVSSYELEKLGTAVSTGDKMLPLGIALKISN